MDKPTAAAPLHARPVRSSTEAVRAASLLVSALCVALAGCAAGSKHKTLPTGGATMAEIYRQHMAGVAQGGPLVARPTLPQPGESTPSYQRTVVNDIDIRFARLPNPDLVMYVTPHLSANGRYPIPGYSTVFPMYETVEYAMPGEVAWRRTAGSATEDEAVQPAQPSRDGKFTTVERGK